MATANPKPQTPNHKPVLATFVVLSLLTFGVLGWCFFAYRMIGDRTPSWRYGAAQSIPAESYASTEPVPPAAKAPKQIELPPPVTGETTR